MDHKYFFQILSNISNTTHTCARSVLEIPEQLFEESGFRTPRHQGSGLDCPPPVDKPARLTIRVLWSLFLIVRRVPRPSESGCKKCNGLKKYLLGHTFSWKRLSAILCPWNPPWWWFFSLKLNKKCLKTPSKIKGLSFISSNLGNMDFFLIFNCISH